jgi:hypothetical protein
MGVKNAVTILDAGQKLIVNLYCTGTDLSTAQSITFELAPKLGDAATLTKTLTASSSTAASVTVDAADTTSLSGKYVWTIVVTDSGGDPDTVSQGVWAVRDAIA